MRPALRRTLWGLGAFLAVVLGFGVFLWFEAGRDLGYLVRVLRYRDSGTDDWRWKRSARVEAAAAPRGWPEAPDCSAVHAVFAGYESWLARGGAVGFVVVRDGAITCEWYGNGGARDRPAAAFSVSKTVVSLLLARAVAEGRVSGLDEPITTRVPALAARDARFAGVTLAGLVDMRSGIAFSEEVGFPWVNRDAPAVYYASDLAHTVVTRPRIEAAPGARFVYNDYAPNLIGLVLERAYGAKLAPGPMQAMWTELGAESPALWSVDDEGFAWHESGLVVTARDLARVGQLILDGGRAGDRQVAPTAWLERSLDPAGRAEVVDFGGTRLGYRNGWWVTADGQLVAMGRHGQIMLVSPSTRTVIVRLGRDGHAETNVSIARRLAVIAR